MSKAAAKSDALATAPTTALATGPVDALAGLELPSDYNDGLSEVEREDIKISARVFNFKGVGKNGRKIPEDEFYDTVDETVSQSIDAVFIDMHKTHLYTVYDNEEKRNRIVCRSFDRVTGTMEDGTDRPCKGCPDWQWRKDPETGKRTKNCGTVVNMYSEDRATRAPFLIRFKRTSLPVIMQHLQKHHILRRMLPGGVRGHYPLFIYPVKLTCKMSDNGNYAIPVVERGEQLSNDEIISYARQATELRESFLAAAERLETQVESQTSAEAGDTSFDTDKFEQGAGQNFVE